ncbi:thiamine kinase-like enzyme [Acinetobacter calcoaceticus]|uniref:Thiamine kinase-like enzyme n=1 Tax=Acinetobacter calcoaceticus TaxID=471 RepID=A0A4R1XAQ6_ACICA|nr:thiamine kinase-like enzyme [Acinetobacter calcoaceticus]
MNRMFNEIVKKMPGYQGQQQYSVQEIFGGLSNSNWLLDLADRHYFVKIFGEGTEQFIDRQLAYEALQQAHELGISPQIVCFDPEHRAEVTEFLDGYRPSVSSDFARKEFLQAAIAIYKKLHSAKSLNKTKTVFDMTDEHILQGDQLGAIRPYDFAGLMQKYQQAKSAFFASGLDLAPCHNDPMPGNFMVKMTANDHIQSMKLIDFEFASNNERAYEVGVFLSEVFVDEPTSLELIEAYYGQVRDDLVARVYVARAVADMKWASWAVQQRQLSSWDFDYQKYGIWKYARARKLFNDPRWEAWVRMV